MVDNRKFNVLSLCGGGVRGLITAAILKEIEQRLMRKLSTFNVRIADFYDLIAGTSAGGFLTSLLLAPLSSEHKTLSAEEIYQIFYDATVNIFLLAEHGEPLRDPELCSKNINNILNKIFGKMELKDLLKPSLITAYEPNREWLSFFKQHYAQRVPEYNFFLSDVVAATFSMPVHFNPVKTRSFSDNIVRRESFSSIISKPKIQETLLEELVKKNIVNTKGEILIEMDLSCREKLGLSSGFTPLENYIYDIIERIANPKMLFIDGSMFANNPSMSALIEIHNIANTKKSNKNVTLLSLGTGINQIYHEYNVQDKDKLTSKLLNMLFTSSEKLSHFQTYITFETSKATDNYIHLNPVIMSSGHSNLPTYSINDIRPENIKTLLSITESYIKAIDHKLDDYVEHLIKNQYSS